MGFWMTVALGISKATGLPFEWAMAWPLVCFLLLFALVHATPRQRALARRLRGIGVPKRPTKRPGDPA